MINRGIVRTFVLLFATIFSIVSNAQTVSVLGKVINLRNEPIAGATIKIEETNKQVSANVEGVFRLSLEKNKKYTLLVSSTGYN
ncbi:MAG: carboxypeptidase-like regulatory domain-containing protein [Chitinophagaceae bacterium]